MLFNSFFFWFCWNSFFLPSRYFIHLRHGIHCLPAWLTVGVSLCINCCLLILPLLPTFVLWCSVFIFFNVRAMHTHTFYSHSVSRFAYVQHVRLLFAFALALALFFSRPLDARTTYTSIVLYVYAIKRRLHALIAEAVFFLTPSVPLYLPSFFSPLTQNNIGKLPSSLQSFKFFFRYAVVSSHKPEMWCAYHLISNLFFFFFNLTFFFSPNSIEYVSMQMFAWKYHTKVCTEFDQQDTFFSLQITKWYTVFCSVKICFFLHIFGVCECGEVFFLSRSTKFRSFMKMNHK